MIRRLAAISGFLLAALLAMASLAAPAGASEPPPVDLANLDMLPLRVDGVQGQNPSQTQTPTLDVLVWDMQQVDDKMFVGGAFLNVQPGRNGTPVSQPYLAAFDINTGDWIDTCRPTFDRAIYSLEVSSRGRLLVGGEFENVNGTSRRGLVALRADNCEIDPLFAGAVDRPFSTDRAVVRDMEVIGDTLWVGGNFSHLDGPNSSRTRVYKAGKMDARWGNFDANFKPEVAGSGIWGLAVDPVRDRVHFAGFFSSVNGLAASGNFHTVNGSTGATVPGLTPLPRNYPQSQPEMYDVEVGVGTVVVAGEQHVVQTLDANTHAMVAFSGTGFTGCNGDSFRYCGGFSGGAYQVAQKIGGVMFAGCHCTRGEVNGNLSHYNSVTNQRTDHRLMMAYDPSSGLLLTGFRPDIQSPRDGGWTATSDTNGCLYLGGDYHVGGVDAGTSIWLGGFAKLCPVDYAPPGPDEQAPSVPQNLAATDAGGGNVALTWTASTDNVEVQSYLIYRNGGYHAWSPTPSYTDVGAGVGPFTYEVRAVDTSGNRSEKSTAVTYTAGGPDIEPPSVPQNLAIADLGGNAAQLTWTASTDNIGVQSYLIYADNAYLGWSPTNAYTASGLIPGVPRTYEIRAVDTSGNRSDKSAGVSYTAGGIDTEPPSTPTNLVATNLGGDSVGLAWTASTDNVGIMSYLIYRNNAYIGWSATPAFTDGAAPIGVPTNYEVRAVDLSGNRSAKSLPVTITPV